MYLCVCVYVCMCVWVDGNILVCVGGGEGLGVHIQNVAKSASGHNRGVYCEMTGT